MNNPRVVVSILNWNNAKATIRCIESLDAAGYCDNPNIEICVTDNASIDSDRILLGDYLSSKNIVFRCNKENIGFAAGHNEVIDFVIARDIDYVWLLNNDCLVEPGTIESLLKTMSENPECGACSPVMAYEDTRKVYFSGAYQNWSSLRSIWCPTPWSDEFHRRHRNDIWLVGTAFLLRIVALKKTGLLNEDLFAYCEDDDLGERLNRGKWRNIVLKDIILYHGFESAVEVKRPPYFYYLTARNHTYFYLKYTPAPYRRLIKTRLIAHSVDRSSILASQGYPLLAHAVLAGLQDGLSGVLGKPEPAKPLAEWFKAVVLFIRGINKVHQLFQGAKRNFS